MATRCLDSKHKYREKELEREENGHHFRSGRAAHCEGGAPYGKGSMFGHGAWGLIWLKSGVLQTPLPPSFMGGGGGSYIKMALSHEYRSF